MIRYHKLLLLTFFCLCTEFGNAATPATKFIYTLDITRVKDDKLQVELDIPKLSQSEITFYIPKIIPGTYRVADYGRFISELKAFDKKGRPLSVQKLDDNSWKIVKAKKLRKISYWVEDTYDTKITDNLIFPMAGTNIDEGKNIVINTPGYFGYFDGMHKSDYEINIVRPKKFYGSTGLRKTRSFSLNELDTNKGDGLNLIGNDKMVDTYNVSNYQLLIDSPMMYNVPDTTILNVGGTEVLISAYAPQGIIDSKYLAETIEPILMAQKEYLGGKLPVDKYAFIYYFEDHSKMLPINGALEHSYSSFYYFPEVPKEYLTQTMKDVAAHEFFHIVTPLNIHSEEIEYFDFNEPKISKHLWLYEGMTEYFSDNVQVKYDLMSDEDYLKALRTKIVTCTERYNDTLSFTELSKRTLHEHKKQYGNVYEKGALIGMCLDIKLRKESNGAYGVQDLISDLSNKYGKNTPFKDEELFGVIVEMTYPEIDKFIQEYIVKGGVLPYQEVFEIVGVEYIPFVDEERYTFGFGKALGVDSLGQSIQIIDASRVDDLGQELGFQTGDIILKVNGKEVPEVSQVSSFLSDQKLKLEELDEISYVVLRKDESGNESEVLLKAQSRAIPYKKKHVLQFSENATDDQVRIRESWLRARK